MQATSSGKKKQNCHKKISFRIQSIVNALIYFYAALVYTRILTHTINEMQKFYCMMFRTLGEVDGLTLCDVSVLTLLRFETLRFDTLTLSDTTLLCYAVFCRSTK
jgi:hypothetical protein